jgi:hypothetical protein
MGARAPGHHRAGSIRRTDIVIIINVVNGLFVTQSMRDLQLWSWLDYVASLSLPAACLPLARAPKLPLLAWYRLFPPIDFSRGVRNIPGRL